MVFVAVDSTDGNLNVTVDLFLEIPLFLFCAGFNRGLPEQGR